MGPINNADINLKPLTVFIGENNTGKTYAAYSIFDFFNKDSLDCYEIKHKKIFIDKTEILNNFEFNDKSNISINIDDIIDFIYKNINYFEEILSSNDYQKMISEKIDSNINNFQSFFGSEPYIDKYQMIFSFDEKDKKINNKNLEKIKQLNFFYPIRNLKIENFKGDMVFVKNKMQNKVSFYISSYIELDIKNLIQTDEFVEIFNKKLIEFILYTIIHSSAPEYTEIFPIYRNTLIIESIQNAINSLMRRLVHTKEESKEKIFSRAIAKNTDIFPTPIIEFLNLMDILIAIGGRKDLSKNNGISDYVENFEENVLGGKIIIKKDTKKGKRLIKYVLSNSNKEIDIITSSSMIQQISSFILFLKYFLRQNCLIIIDEPESNLHPNAQLKFVELLSFLVNNGYWVILTTHTPYIIDHINNLMYGYEVYNKYKLDDESKKKFPLDQNILLNPDDVSTYLFQKNGDTKSIIKEKRITWDTFGSITDNLEDIYDKIRNCEESLKKKKS